MLYNMLISIMLKTYLYLPKQLDEEIKELAVYHQTSKAEVLRSVIKEGVAVFKKRRSGGAEVLFKLAELGKRYKLKGPRDSSQRIDELLWGRDWSKDE